MSPCFPAAPPVTPNCMKATCGTCFFLCRVWLFGTLLLCSLLCSTLIFGLLNLHVKPSFFRPSLKKSECHALLQQYFSQIKTSLLIFTYHHDGDGGECFSRCVCVCVRERDGFARGAQWTPVQPAWVMRQSILQVVWLYFHYLTHAVRFSFLYWMKQHSLVFRLDL